MADKTIGELPQIITLTDAAMLPVEQNNAAGRISGSQWKAYAVDSVSSYVETAQQAASTASGAATTATNKANNAANSATAAANSAATATQKANEIEEMTVSSTTLAPGASATVTKTTVGGVINLAFGLPRGATGEQGATGPQGPQGVQGPKGDTGTAVAVETTGMFYFNVDNDSQSQTYGHLMLTYTGDTAPDMEIDNNGHLIWNVE